MPPKKAGKAAASKKVWVGQDRQGFDQDGKKLAGLQDWWKDFEKKATAEEDPNVPEASPSAPAETEQAPSVSKTPKNIDSTDKVSDKWYSKSQQYWQGMEASDSGMLAGFEATSPVDVAGSRQFLQQFLDGLKDYNLKINPERCIDVGAGIGRISKLLLAKVFKKVDILEQSQQFVEKAREELLAPSSDVASHMGEFYCSPLQTFEFPKDTKYDVIWIQWVLLYLLDVDLIAFLKRCKAALQPNGVILIKENVGKDAFFVDMEDNSISRTPTHFKSVFASAGLKLIRDEAQPDWPPELLPVRMWALL